MDFDYFYGRDAESFRFIRLPIVLIEDEKFKGLSIDAKVLYSMYLSRSTLSYKNNWIDESGRVYIYFTVEETARQLACGTKKAVKLIKDLEYSDFSEYIRVDEKDLREKLGLEIDDEGNFYDPLSKDLDNDGIPDRYDNDFRSSNYFESTYDVDGLKLDDKKSTLGQLERFKAKVKEETNLSLDEKDMEKNKGAR